MTCLEHLIENCLCKFEDGKPYEEIEKAIKNDINLADSGITAEQCYEICQYVWFTFIRYGGYEKINDGDIIIHKDEKERTDEEIKWLVEHNAEVRKKHEKFLEDSGNIILTKEDMQKYANINVFLDLLIEFDEMGYSPTTLCENPEKEAKKFQGRLRKVFVTGIAKILNDSKAEVEKARKETAREILQTLYDQCYEYNPRLPEESIGHILPINILTLAKQYGVEVEE